VRDQQLHRSGLGKNPGEAAAFKTATGDRRLSAIGAGNMCVIAISLAPERCAARADNTLAVE